MGRREPALVRLCLPLEVVDADLHQLRVAVVLVDGEARHLENPSADVRVPGPMNLRVRLSDKRGV